VIANTARIRRAYQKNLEQRCEFYRRELSRAGVEYAEFDTSEPLDRALALFLRVRRAKLSN
jgi:hypothetical protein